MPPHQRLLIFTGTQGEPDSALARLSRNAFKGYKVQEGDTIILSSRIIPGNEKPIWRMINNFYRHGGRVITERDARVHGSGHAYRGEMRQIIGLLRPQYLMPVHGEMRQLIIHRELAVECGLPRERVLVFENGTQLELDKSDVTLTATDWAGQVLSTAAAWAASRTSSCATASTSPRTASSPSSRHRPAHAQDHRGPRHRLARLRQRRGKRIAARRLPEGGRRGVRGVRHRKPGAVGRGENRGPQGAAPLPDRSHGPLPRHPAGRRGDLGRPVTSLDVTWNRLRSDRRLSRVALGLKRPAGH